MVAIEQSARTEYRYSPFALCQDLSWANVAHAASLNQLQLLVHTGQPGRLHGYPHMHQNA